MGVVALASSYWHDDSLRSTHFGRTCLRLKMYRDIQRLFAGGRCLIWHAQRGQPNAAKVAANLLARAGCDLMPWLRYGMICLSAYQRR